MSGGCVDCWELTEVLENDFLPVVESAYPIVATLVSFEQAGACVTSMSRSGSRFTASSTTGTPLKAEKSYERGPPVFLSAAGQRYIQLVFGSPVVQLAGQLILVQFIEVRVLAGRHFLRRYSMPAVPLKLHERARLPQNFIRSRPRPAQLRRDGQVPVLYGHKQEPYAFKTDAHTLSRS